MAHVITPEGIQTEVTPKNGSTFTLEECQGFVGGFIENVPLPNKPIGFDVMLCDEEYLIKKMDGQEIHINMYASILAHQEIYGNVFTCHATPEGEYVE